MNDLMKSSTDSLPQKRAKKKVPAKKTEKLTKLVKKYGLVGSVIVFVVLWAACLFLLKDSINIGAEALANSYGIAYETEKDAAYQALYQSAFDRAEKNYHVSNNVVISIGSFEETEKLEVLKANHVEFITEDRDDNSGNVTAWLEVTGEGTFVVDLKAAEFVVDNEHRYVLVRVPYPELTNVTITDTQKRWYEDDLLNGSYSQGVDLALKQRNEASLQIQKSLMSNQYIYGNAQTVATSIIINLVKQLNPDIPDLTVEVEFVG